MRGGELLDKMDLVDVAYVEAADQLPEKGDRKAFRQMAGRIAACAVCVLLVFVIGATAYAAGAFDKILLYFKGDTGDYMDGIIASTASVSNGEMTLRIDGAIADEHACHLIVSLVGLTEETKKLFTDNVHDEQSALKAYAVSASGEEVSFWNWGSGSVSERIGFRKYRNSFFADADATFVVDCEFDGKHSMSEMDSIWITYQVLALKLDVQQYILPEYKLFTETETELTDLTISGLGVYFEAPEEWFRQARDDGSKLEFTMIRSDGSLYENNQEFGLSWSAGCDEKYAHYSGAWKMKKKHAMMTIDILDLEEYCGIQINGVNYYYKEPMPVEKMD